MRLLLLLWLVAFAEQADRDPYSVVETIALYTGLQWGSVRTPRVDQPRRRRAVSKSLQTICRMAGVILECWRHRTAHLLQQQQPPCIQGNA